MASDRQFESVLRGLALCRKTAASLGEGVLVYFIDMAIVEAEQARAERSTSPRETAVEEHDLTYEMVRPR